jgi:hypothetical protein
MLHEAKTKMKVEFVKESCLNFSLKIPSLFFWAACLLSFGVVISHGKRLKVSRVGGLV